MIEFSCPSCSKTHRVKDEFAGKKAKCKECGSAMPIPAADAPPSVATSAEQPQQADAPPVKRRRKANASGSDEGSSEVLKGSTPNFDYEISQRPDFAMVTINLQDGQKIFAEPSAMASMTPTVTLKAGFKGGLGKTIGRALGG